MRKMVKEVPQQEVFTPDDVDQNRIYICVTEDGNLYKLSRTYTGNPLYQWLSLEYSYMWKGGEGSGGYDNIQEALNSIPNENTVYEFNDTKELAQWLLEQ
jgi:hypothetical protein